MIIIITIRQIKSRRMRWAENVARMGERRGAYREFHILHSVLYNSVVTLQNDRTQFYQNRTNVTTQQLLHVRPHWHIVMDQTTVQNIQEYSVKT